MADQPVVDLTEDTTPDRTDLIYSVKDPSGTPLDRKVTHQNLNRGLVLIETQVASASASLTFTTMPTDFTKFILELSEVLPATDAQPLELQFSTDGGSSYDTGTNYTFYDFILVNTAHSLEQSQSATYIRMGPGQVENTAANGGVNGSVIIHNPHSSVGYKQISSQIASWDARDAYPNSRFGGGCWKSTDNIDALRLMFASGNIASGEVSLYGIRK